MTIINYCVLWNHWQSNYIVITGKQINVQKYTKHFETSYSTLVESFLFNILKRLIPQCFYIEVNTTYMMYKPSVNLTLPPSLCRALVDVNSSFCSSGSIRVSWVNDWTRYTYCPESRCYRNTIFIESIHFPSSPPFIRQARPSHCFTHNKRMCGMQRQSDSNST